MLNDDIFIKLIYKFVKYCNINIKWCINVSLCLLTRDDARLLGFFSNNNGRICFLNDTVLWLMSTLVWTCLRMFKTILNLIFQKITKQIMHQLTKFFIVEQNGYYYKRNLVPYTRTMTWTRRHLFQSPCETTFVTLSGRWPWSVRNICRGNQSARFEIAKRMNNIHSLESSGFL